MACHIQKSMTDDIHELLDFVIFHLKGNGIANHAGTEIHEVFQDFQAVGLQSMT